MKHHLASLLLILGVFAPTVAGAQTGDTPPSETLPSETLAHDTPGTTPETVVKLNWRELYIPEHFTVTWSPESNSLVAYPSSPLFGERLGDEVAIEDLVVEGDDPQAHDIRIQTLETCNCQQYFSGHIENGALHGRAFTKPKSGATLTLHRAEPRGEMLIMRNPNFDRLSRAIQEGTVQALIQKYGSIEGLVKAIDAGEVTRADLVGNNSSRYDQDRPPAETGGPQGDAGEGSGGFDRK